MYESWNSTSWIDERQQELRRVIEDERERYADMLRAVAQERELDHTPSARREPSLVCSIGRLIARVVSIRALHRGPTSASPAAGPEIP